MLIKFSFRWYIIYCNYSKEKVTTKIFFALIYIEKYANKAVNYPNRTVAFLAYLYHHSKKLYAMKLFTGVCSPTRFPSSAQKPSVS